MQSNNEKLLENPYLQMRGILQLASDLGIDLWYSWHGFLRGYIVWSRRLVLVWEIVPTDPQDKSFIIQLAYILKHVYPGHVSFLKQKIIFNMAEEGLT